MTNILSTISLLLLSIVSFSQIQGYEIEASSKVVINKSKGWAKNIVVNDQLIYTKHNLPMKGKYNPDCKVIIVKDTDLKELAIINLDFNDDTKDDNFHFQEIVDCTEEQYYVFEYETTVTNNSLRSYDLRTGKQKSIKLGALAQKEIDIIRINNGLLLGRYTSSKKTFVFNLNTTKFKHTTVPDGSISIFDNGYKVISNGEKQIYDDDFNLKHKFTTSFEHPEFKFYNYATHYSKDGHIYYAGYYRNKLKNNGTEKKKVKRKSKINGIFFMKFDHEGNRILTTTKFEEIAFNNIQSDGSFTEWFLNDNGGSDKIQGKEVSSPYIITTLSLRTK